MSSLSLLQVVVGEGFLHRAAPKHGLTVNGIRGHAAVAISYPNGVIQGVDPDVNFLLLIHHAPHVGTIFQGGVILVLVNGGFGNVFGGGSLCTADHGDANSCDEN